MKKYLLLLALVCLLGNRVLAIRTTTVVVTKTIDFTGLPTNQNNDVPNASIVWDGTNSNIIQGINNNNGDRLRSFTSYPISVGNGGNNNNTWRLWKGSHGETYLQKHAEGNNSFSIDNLKDGDLVTIYGDNGNQNGYFRVTSGNTDHNNQDINFNDQNHQANQVLKMSGDGKLTLEFYGQYSGILKVEIKTTEEQISLFDYDPGYEEYDLYDTKSSTTYTLVGDGAGFKLNGQNAKYMEFDNYKLTANNRIALTNTNWTFNFGMVPPGNNDEYSYFSICNLREGDRVVISYTNTSDNALIFASGKDNNTGSFYYNGSAAFRDVDNDGVFNNGDTRIEAGAETTVDWSRDEGYIAQQQQERPTPVLKYTNSYVITQDGHLDLAFRKLVYNNGNNSKHTSRIVKIKIYSDHQAMMVDKAVTKDDGSIDYYEAYFDITGQLQAKEHIMPGGLEVHVGNDDPNQHSIVVASNEGPVSYVNAVDGIKIPGVTGDGGNRVINFDLGIKSRDASKLPTTGTFYRFIPEANGKMKFKFDAKSMNYYRWDIPGNSAYYNDDAAQENGDDSPWNVQMDRPNEQTLNERCPYYLVTVDKNGRIAQITRLQKDGLDPINGKPYESNEINVTAGNTYYLFGGWNSDDVFYNSSYYGRYPDPNSTIQNNSSYNNIEFKPFTHETTKACGVAELLWVEFKADNKIYPLAKWVPNGTTAVNDVNKNNSEKHGVPNPDTYEMEYELADLEGFIGYDNKVTVKKMSANIISCRPYIVRNTGEHNKGKLMIDNIVFADKNKGGTILIKIGDPKKKTDPLYALTIAYSAKAEHDQDNADGSRGHTWNFYKESLKGLTWDNPQSTKAVETPMGTYFKNYSAIESQLTQFSKMEDVSEYIKTNNQTLVNTGSLLEQEIDYVDEHNLSRSDWTFSYNLIYDGNLFDPIFTNKYDMVGDNADMIWDTEGTVFQTSANQSGVFNEYVNSSDNTGKNTVNHAQEVDPNRYVGILKGGKFRIPWLEKDDRVIIWMGSGTGRTNDFVSFKIKNARDAVYNPISENDEYIVGGSQWQKDKDKTVENKYGYFGCYHFFAQGGPTVDGKTLPADMIFEMTGGELCKIYKIQIYRGDRIDTNEIMGATENDNKYLLWSRAADPNEATSTTNKDYTEENRPNWTLQYFGKDQKLADGTNSVENDIISQTGNLTKAITTNTTDNTFTYEHALGEIGTFRMRGKDMEKNMKYVADYADHNVTVAYQQTMEYPYTWDFKDMIGFSGDDILDEDALEAAKPTGFDDDYWDSIKKTYYEITANDLSLWETYTETGGYYLRLNSQANQSLDDPMEKDNIFETAQAIGGNQVWANGKVVPETQGLWFYTDDNFNHSDWYISNAGMEFRTKAHKLVVPNVPAGAAVYLRVNKTQTSHEFTWQWTSDCEVYGGEPQQVGNTNDYIFAIKNNGAKRNLVLSLKGYKLLKLGVSKDKKKLGKYGWATESRERIIDPSLTAYLSGKDIETIIATATDYASRTVTLERMNLNDGGDLMQATNADGTIYACILHNVTADEPVTVLDGGFHLFVPDMHDYDVKTPANSQKKFTLADKSIMKAQLTASQVKWSDDNGDTKNFVLTNTYLKVDKDDKLKDGATNEATGEGFYRVGKNNPITSSGNQGYLPVSTYIAEGQAKFSIVFVDFEDNFQGIATGITEAAPANEGGPNIDDNAEWFNLNGQKLNSKPSERGIYIVNGKKVMVK